MLALPLVDCLRVVGTASVGRGPEKSCGTRILGLAEDGAVSHECSGATQWLKYAIKILNLPH